MLVLQGSHMRKALLAVSLTETNQIAAFELNDPEDELCTFPISGKQPYGLAFDEASKRVFATCWGDAKVLAIDELGSLNRESPLVAARKPAWASLRRGAGELWISNEGADVVTVIDIAEWKIAGEIATGGGPSDVAFTDEGRYAWVTNEKDGTLSLIDATKRRKVQDIRVGEVPQGIAIADGGKQLLVANFGSNNISVVDTGTKRELTQIPVGRGPVDVVTVGSGGLEEAWVSCFAGGVLSIVSIAQRQQVQQIPIGGKPQGLETHPDGGRVYMAVRELNEVVVLSCSRPSRILRRISVPGGPARMTVTAVTDAYRDIQFRSDAASGRRSNSRGGARSV